MGWLETFEKHWCDFPYDVSPEDVRDYWECPKCLTVFRVRVDPWYGSWWADYDSGRIKDPGGGLSEIVGITHEKFVVIEPVIHFEVVRKGVWDLGISGSQSTWGAHNLPKPDWSAKEGDRRPLTSR